MKKQRIRALCAAASLIISLSGCQKSTPLQKERYYIFATPLADHAIWTRARDGFFDACEDLGVHGDWLGPNIIDVDKMETVIETGILQKADGIITQGVVDHEVLSLAREARIPVVLVDSDMRPVDRLCFIGKDFHRQAVLFLEDIEKRVGKDTFLNIAIQAANLDFQIAQDQIEQIRQVFAAHPGGFAITSLSQSLSDEVRSRKEWETVFQDNTGINIAINFAGESACCCYDAAAALGLEEDLLIYGVDDIEQTMDYVRDGRLTGTLVTSFYQYGYEGVMILETYLNEQTAPSFSDAVLSLVTIENIGSLQQEKDDD